VSSTTFAIQVSGVGGRHVMPNEAVVASLRARTDAAASKGHMRMTAHVTVEVDET